MASIMYHKEKQQWRVRKHITNRRTKEVRLFDRLLPKGSTRADAYEMAAALDRLANNIKLGIQQVIDTLPETVEKWMNIMTTHTPRYYDLCRRSIDRFIESLPPNVKTVHDIAAIHIQSHIESILDKNSARTANSRLTIVKSFCRWYSRLYDMPNPADRVLFLAEEPPDRRFLTAEEYEKILAMVDGPTADKFIFLANTGLRASEFCGLKWEDIDEAMGSLSILGKGRKRRTLPLNQTCKGILQRLPRDGEYVFSSRTSNPQHTGQPLRRGSLYNLCADSAKLAQIPAFGPHALRHYFCTELLKADVPIVKVSMVMGHGSTKITQQVYSHIMPADLKGVTDCLDNRNPDPGKNEPVEEIADNGGKTISIVGYKRQIANAGTCSHAAGIQPGPA